MKIDNLREDDRMPSYSHGLKPGYRSVWFKKVEAVYTKEANGFAFEGPFLPQNKPVEIGDDDIILRVHLDEDGDKQYDLMKKDGEIMSTIIYGEWNASGVVAVKDAIKGLGLPSIRVVNKFQKRPKKGSSGGAGAEVTLEGCSDSELVMELLKRGLMGSDGRLASEGKAAA
jgi:hypothetical protein